MRSLVVAATICLLCTPPVFQQETTKGSAPSTSTKDGMIVMSGPATTAKIADPNSLVVFNGFVMKVADFVSMVSSGTEAVQHLRSQETQNRETERPTPPSPPSN